MCSARVAQWILSQVLPLDRAASAVGDWLEDAPNGAVPGSGPVSFERSSRAPGPGSPGDL